MQVSAKLGTKVSSELPIMANFTQKDKKLQLVFGSFNVQGSLVRKSEYQELKGFINSTDLTVIQESWLTKGENFKISNFRNFKAIRKKSKNGEI